MCRQQELPRIIIVMTGIMGLGKFSICVDNACMYYATAKGREKILKLFVFPRTFSPDVTITYYC